jgi:peptidyl-prolyl cis-trans isomerase D
MLESIRRGQRWLVGLVVGGIGLVFALWLPSSGQQGGTTAVDSVVEVDDLVIDVNDFYRRLEQQENQLREQLGDDFDQKGARSFLQQQVLRQLVEQGVLAYSARELGIRVTKPEIQRFLRDTYRNADGSFDEELLVDLIEQSYGTQGIFLETIEREFLSTKMVQLLYSQAHVSELEAGDMVRFGSDDVQIAYVQLDTTQLPDDREPDEAGIEAFRAGNEDALRARYDEQIDRYSTPDRVRARHLLIEVPAGADSAADATARDEAEEARKRIAEGADFAEVARELSDDAGTREAGGELGIVSRQEIAQSIAEAAFDLPVGSVSQVVRGLRGYHVVRVEEKLAGGTRSYEEVAPELAREGARLEAARERANELASELAELVRGGSSLEAAARLHELTLVRTGGLRRRPDGFIPDLGAAPELLALAFALEPGESSPRIFELGNRLVMIQSLARNTPDELTVQAQLAGARDALLSQKRNQLVRAWLDSQQQRLEADGKLRVNASLVIGS